MEYMEQQMQQFFEHGEDRMEHCCKVAEQMELFMKDKGISIFEIEDTIDLFRQMKWSWFKEPGEGVE